MVEQADRGQRVAAAVVLLGVLIGWGLAVVGLAQTFQTDETDDSEPSYNLLIVGGGVSIFFMLLVFYFVQKHGGGIAEPRALPNLIRFISTGKSSAQIGPQNSRQKG